MLETDPWGIGTTSGTRMEVFVCLSEKYLQTIWDEITSDFKDMQYLNLTQETIWNETRSREMSRPLTPVEDRRIKEGIPKETVVKASGGCDRTEYQSSHPEATRLGSFVSWNIKGCPMSANGTSSGSRVRPRTSTYPFEVL